MIISIGTDVTEIKQIIRSIELTGERFIKKVFTVNEISISLGRNEIFAVLFAIKESVMKAIGTGWAKGVSWRQIETIKLENECAVISISGEVSRLCEVLKVKKIHTTYSITKDFAIAIVIFEK